VTREDVDRVVGELAAQGLAASTRRGYVQAFKNFHAFLAVRKAAEIEAAFGIRHPARGPGRLSSTRPGT
jgi:site-specific recombinase XerD